MRVKHFSDNKKALTIPLDYKDGSFRGTTLLAIKSYSHSESSLINDHSCNVE